MKDLIIPEETLMSKIYIIRDVKVMIDSDLAELYQVETKSIESSD
jgi:ORF6N domain-containing protein